MRNHLTSKNIVMVLFVIIVFGSILYTAKPFQKHTQVTDSRIAALLNERTILNEPLVTADQRPSYLIINFWASWCPPCILETPSLTRFVTERKNQFSFIAVSEDNTIEDIFNFIKLYPQFSSLSSNIIYDQSKKLSRLFRVEKLPETFIYSFEKNQILQISGSINWAEPGLEEKIKSKLENQIQNNH